jgi:hypothetical protein
MGPDFIQQPSDMIFYALSYPNMHQQKRFK